MTVAVTVYWPALRSPVTLSTAVFPRALDAVSALSAAAAPLASVICQAVVKVSFAVMGAEALTVTLPSSVVFR